MSQALRDVSHIGDLTVAAHESPPVQEARAARAWRWSLAALGLAAAAHVLARTTSDPDLWGHVRYGLDMLAARALVTTDPYSYLTASQTWINHEWLAEVLFGLAWLAGGAAGLIALKAGVAALTLALLWGHLRSLGLPGVRAVSILLLLGGPLFLPFFAMVRPQIFTFLLFALTLLVIRRAESGAYRWLWAAPPITAAWVNLHGGVLAGLGMLALWALLHLPRHWAARRRIFWPAVATLLALRVNPYGAELPAFLLQTATVPRPEIKDWQPLMLLSVPGAVHFVLVATMAAGLWHSRRERGVVTVVVCAMAALLPFASARHMPLAAIMAVIFAGEHVADAWLRSVARLGRPVSGAPPLWLSALAGAAALGLLVGTAAQGHLTRIQVLDKTSVPAAAVRLLADSRVAGNLVVDFNWGQYVIWHLGPGVKVSMDGRRETIYPPRIYQQYLQFALGRGDWSALLRESPADMALVGAERPPANLLRLSDEWQVAFEDGHSVLFVRRESAVAPRVLETARHFVAPEPTAVFP